MDDNLDDLFGDAAPLQISIPVSPALVSVLNERSSKGCCQKISWSRFGAVAYVTADKRRVVLQHLVCEPPSGEWILSKPHVVSEVTETHSNAYLTCVSWSQTGDQLAICDSHGRISIHATPVVNCALNRLALSRRSTVDPEDDFGSVVGWTWWQERGQTYLNRPASRKDGQWTFTVVPQASHGPKLQKAALFCVSRRGTVNVLYQDKDNRWAEMPMELEPSTRSTKIVTHATFCVDRTNNVDAMLLATCTVDRELRVYRLRTDYDKFHVTVQHLALLPSCTPFIQVEESLPGIDETAAQHDQLIQLDFLPAGPEAKNRPRTPPRILATFSHASHDYQGTDTLGTLVCAWSLNQNKPSLHPALSHIFPGKANENVLAGLSPEFNLAESAGFSTAKILLYLQQINMSTTLAFAWNDGSLDLRDSLSLNILPADGPDQISSLPQIGFILPANRSCVHLALSPNSSAAFSMDETSSSSITFLEYENLSAPNGSLDESLLATISEAFAVHLSIAAKISNPDDLLATIQVFSRQHLTVRDVMNLTPSLANLPNFNRAITCGICRHLLPDPSIAEQPEKFAHSSVFQQYLGLQSMLVIQSGLAVQAIEGKTSVMLIHLRFFTLVLAFVCTPRKNTTGEAEPMFRRPDIAQFLLSLVSWLLTLFCYIVDELLAMLRTFEDSGILQDHVDANLINQNIQQAQSPALLLLFGAKSRAILKYSNQLMKILMAESAKQRDSSTLGRIYRELDLILRRSPVKVAQFDQILHHIDESVNSAFQSPAIDEIERKSAEQQILIEAKIPSFFTQAVTQLLFKTLKSLKEEIDEAKLYFLDFTTLGLAHDPYSARKCQQNPIDVITKVPLRTDAKIRRCPHCCSATEDLVPKKTSNYITMGFGRQCLCGSMWMAVDD